MRWIFVLCAEERDGGSEYTCFCFLFPTITDWEIIFQLLRVNPMPNTLALVFRTEDTLRFTKYVNDRLKDIDTAKFHHLLGVYVENAVKPNWNLIFLFYGGNKDKVKFGERHDTDLFTVAS
jgi:hypothetical protein